MGTYVWKSCWPIKCASPTCMWWLIVSEIIFKTARQHFTDRQCLLIVHPLAWLIIIETKGNPSKIWGEIFFDIADSHQKSIFPVSHALYWIIFHDLMKIIQIRYLRFTIIFNIYFFLINFFEKYIKNCSIIKPTITIYGFLMYN